MEVACIQPEILKSKKDCYNKIETLIRELINKNPDIEITCLPERWLPLSSNMSENIQKERGESYQIIKELAQQYNISILSGGIWERRNPSKKPWITCYYFNNQGKELGRQDKIHLYSFEKKNFQKGHTLHIFKFKNYKFCILICFDMAFFETPRFATLNGAEVLFSPTQIREDGMFNWNIYLKARALENRIPVVASNSFGSIFERKFIGESKILSFEDGFISPSKLNITKAPANKSSFIHKNLNLEFSNELREIRLNERVEFEDLRVIKH
jgi:predicted amidohydrolase